MVSIADRIRQGAEALLRSSPFAASAPAFSIAFSLPLSVAMPLPGRHGQRPLLRGQPMLATLQFSVSRDPGVGPAPLVRAVRTADALPVATQLPASHPRAPARRQPGRRERAAERAVALFRHAQAHLPQAATAGFAQRMRRFRTTEACSVASRLPAGRLPVRRLAEARRSAPVRAGIGRRRIVLPAATSLLAQLTQRCDEILGALRKR
jgi:hypothetical protein